MESINSWLEHWEATWLFLILFIETVVSGAILWWTVREYKYDEGKDLEKNRKRTKTTRKTTKGKEGETVEEITETSEPIDSNHNKNP